MKLRSYSDWDHRPAALFDDPRGGFFALAMLKPGGPGVPVDADDVFHTAGLLSAESSEEVLRARFGWYIGDAEVPTEANVASFIPAVAAE